TQTNRWWPMISRWEKTGSSTSKKKVDRFELGDATDLDSGIIYGMIRATSGDVWVTVFDAFNGKMSNTIAIHNGEAAYAESNNGVFVSSCK
ncbi:hypothetical protein BGZ52_008423, partial [Haplosporangium bisporale]